MSNGDFHTILSSAISGSMESLADLVELYMPLINNYSVVDGKIDEDLRQSILLELVRSISRFRI